CRIPLEAKQKKKVDFYIDPSQLAFLDEDMKWKIEAGEFDVMIGSSSEDIRLKTNVYILEDGYTQSKNREYYASYKISE
ncbi:fibronectin type III-like domain-contianing protein, partial [Paenibacillus polymyxa]|uniref:fibronectin type III-like domain-contianing protein n=2 Tax=Paenibacillus TaxID=44249 RepID=UPI00129BF3FA